MKANKAFYWILIILVGSIIGSIIGNALDQYLPILNYGKSIGLAPATLDLEVIAITFGFKAKLTVAGVIGMLLAIFIFRKL